MQSFSPIIESPIQENSFEQENSDQKQDFIIYLES